MRPDLVPFEVKNRAGLTALLDKNKFYEPMQTARQRITGESVLDCLDIPFSNQWEEELDQDLTVNKNISVYMNDRNKVQIKAAFFQTTFIIRNITINNIVQFEC